MEGKEAAKVIAKDWTAMQTLSPVQQRMCIPVQCLDTAELNRMPRRSIQQWRSTTKLKQQRYSSYRDVLSFCSQQQQKRPLSDTRKTPTRSGESRFKKKKKSWSWSNAQKCQKLYLGRDDAVIWSDRLSPVFREKNETSSPSYGILPGSHPAPRRLLPLPAVPFWPASSLLFLHLLLLFLLAEAEHLTWRQESADRS